MEEEVDLLIIGAGWHGLSLAKTHLEIHPTRSLLILDSAHSIGGVWARERLYPGLKTNNLVGSYEFSDFPMVGVERYGVSVGKHIPGEVVGRYLEDFAGWCGLSIEGGIEKGEKREGNGEVRLGWCVDSAELVEGKEGERESWIVRARRVRRGGIVDDDDGPATGSDVMKARAKTLVVATGLTSQPSVPEFRGRNSFSKPILHSREFHDRKADVEAAKRIVVVGGNKSAWDACYWAASKGAQVDLVMRPSGGGPSWVWPVFVSPFKISIQILATTRLSTWFDPVVWTPSDPYRWMKWVLHRTWLGQLLVTMFWTVLGWFVSRANQYDTHPEMRKLKPWISPFWMGNSLSIHNYDSCWFDLVRNGLIKVHIAEVKSLSHGIVHLSNGEDVETDALVCCTGWKVVPPIKFLPDGILNDLGLPSHQNEDDDVGIQRARAEILRDYPNLRYRPSKTLPLGTTANINSNISEKQNTSYRLYRFLVPSHERFLRSRNIAFIGTHLAIAAVMVAQAQALWITAFFDDAIDHLQRKNIDYRTIRHETIRHSEYCRMRHPPDAGGCGNRCPDLVFDCLPYIDMLLDDLKLTKFRKRNNWREIIERYTLADYRGIVQEWKSNQMMLEHSVTVPTKAVQP